MRWVSFKADGRESYGQLVGDSVVEPGEAFRAMYPDLRAVIAAGKLSDFEQGEVTSNHRLDAVELLPLIPNPDKVLCVGVNYRPHIEEMGRQVPDYPVVFVRFSASQVGHEQAIINPRASEQYDFEGELAIVIGKPARHVHRDQAWEYIAGYCCFMDGSVRDWQKHTMQFTGGKNFHRSGSMGPYLTTADEIPDPTLLSLTTRVNGEVMQQGQVSELIFDISALIEYCSTFTELLPGDVIATGTPGGVGAARTPPKWLRGGDVVEVDIPGVGQLRNTVVDE
jgi:2-keto-4-pentenoate hydratase/2-oxohepta-3-ene-1,7-dioic acid hydratase in catechol pathway